MSVRVGLPGAAQRFPAFLAVARVVAWWWSGVAAAAAIILSLLAIGLPSSTWFVVTGGRLATDQTVLAPTVVLIGFAWSLVVGLVVLGVLLPRAPDRARPVLLVVVELLMAVVAWELAAVLLVAIPQLGAATPWSAARAQSLRTPANVLALVTAVLWLATGLILPWVAAGRRRPATRRRPRAAR